MLLKGAGQQGHDNKVFGSTVKGCRCTVFNFFQDRPTGTIRVDFTKFGQFLFWASLLLRVHSLTNTE